MTEKLYTIDEVWEERQKSFKDGFDHRQPSEPTITFMKETMNTLKEVRDGFLEVKLDVGYIKKELEEQKTKYANKEITNNKIENLKKRVNGHDDNLKWMVRLVIGSIITALLALVLSSKM